MGADATPHVGQLAQPRWAPAPGGPLVCSLGRPGFALLVIVLPREVVLVGRAGPGWPRHGGRCSFPAVCDGPRRAPHCRRTRALSACCSFGSQERPERRRQGAAGGTGAPGHQAQPWGPPARALSGAPGSARGASAPCRALPLVQPPGGARPSGQWPDSWTRRAADRVMGTRGQRSTGLGTCVHLHALTRHAHAHAHTRWTGDPASVLRGTLRPVGSSDARRCSDP